MPRSDKRTMSRRVDDVMQLVLAGAGLADIRQFASARGWDVSERQVRRYQELAYKRLAKTTNRNRKQLLGRHLQQRRALYARCVKDNDNRTALNVLRDEAALEGLYPDHDQSGQLQPVAVSPLSRRERTVRLLAAEAQGDKTQLGLLDHASPSRRYILPDTFMPQQMLHIMALMYVTEQLEQAAACINAMFCQTRCPSDDEWDDAAKGAAYLYRIGRDAWHQFMKSLGLDPDLLVKANYLGRMLAFCDENVCGIAPTEEQAQALLARCGRPEDKPKTAATLEKSWRRLFAAVCPD